ncbi:MAG TPA: transaldolase [Microbacteriaceae bacterium]|nr:transaldolase [Microbacteriaceae bacterium]
MSNIYTEALSQAGVSIWLDDLTRSMLQSEELSTFIKEKNVVGVTTNPSIFASAIKNDASYRREILDLSRSNVSVQKIIETLTIKDVQDACDVLYDIFVNTHGNDGRVSIEVEPEHAHDTDATVQRAQEIWDLVDRPNVMIKIPATKAGLSAISQTIALGISVNVTLIFSIMRYREVASAYMYGLELALQNGFKLNSIQSVASVFISRFDTELATAAEKNEQLQPLQNKIGIANAKLTNDAFNGIWSTERASYLLDQGANVQRLLWASTGVKSNSLPLNHYVAELVGPNSVNTMPKETLEACTNGLEVNDSAIATDLLEAATDVQTMTNNGLDYVELTQMLETEGLKKFSVAWEDLVESVQKQISEA